MAISFYTGKPGGGKTYKAVDMIVKELRSTQRNIVTNVALNLPELAQYLHDTYGETFNMRERIRILSEEDLSQFWRFYGPHSDQKITGKKLVPHHSAPKTKGEEVRMVCRDDFDCRNGQPAVFYVLDEIHTAFNARNWQNTGDDVLYYNSQHRKLGDDVIAITQSLGNVDKQFKSVAQEFVVIRNHGKEKLPLLGGIFRSVGIFSTSSYLDVPSPGGGSLCQETKVFRLDVKGLANCYNTAAGVGIHSHSGGDKNAKASGLHPAWVIVFLILLGALLYKLPDWFAGAATSHARAKHMGVPMPTPTPANTATNAGGKQPMVFQAKPVQASPTLPQVVMGQPGQATTPDQDKPKERFLVGASKLDGVWTVYLSDGSRYRSGIDPEFTAYVIDQRVAIIGGQSIRWRLAEVPTPQAPATTALFGHIPAKGLF